ncbi:MAG: H/ACA RNA-protein complex protein Gar1 [Thermoprotei archaeon]|nr:MAG: H/ACA RNA-protein complex protein Gar1 [Thermoprotei archaeon]RLF03616.1 MAG: H/ACA RNA-protein complex protein Gar1 [Thermoprotei archaeon]
MRRLGKVLHVTKTGRLLVKVENMPHLFDDVFDEKLRRVGRVYDVLGPTVSPYVSVEIEDSVSPESLVGKVLYITVRERKGRGRRRRGSR